MPTTVEFSAQEPDWMPGDLHGREALLLERRSRYTVQIVSALFSDLTFRRVEPGTLDDGTQAVLWSYMVQCGSCHSGPEGILLWNQSDATYDWNKNWIKTDTVSKEIKAVLPENYYLDEAESLYWDETRSSLMLRAQVHKDTDAHCCPNGGDLSADVKVNGGTLLLSG